MKKMHKVITQGGVINRRYTRDSHAQVERHSRKDVLIFKLCILARKCPQLVSTAHQQPIIPRDLMATGGSFNSISTGNRLGTVQLVSMPIYYVSRHVPLVDVKLDWETDGKTVNNRRMKLPFCKRNTKQKLKQPQQIQTCDLMP